MKNSDSTSGNAQEQLPKFLLILSLWDFFFGKLGSGTPVDLLSIAIFYLFVLVFAAILHRNLFDWKPKMYSGFTRDHFPQPEKAFLIKPLSSSLMECARNVFMKPIRHFSII